MTVYFWSPDVNHPSGGIRAIYRFTDALASSGIDAAVMHQRRGFRASWFQNTTPVVAAEDVAVRGNDVLVLSELDAPSTISAAPGVTKVILNQHQYWTFVQGPVDYLHPDVASVIAVSDDGMRYLTYAFPGLQPHRVRCAVDTDLFRPRVADRERAIVFLAGKGTGPRTQVTRILAQRGLIQDWELRPLSGLPQDKMAEALGRVAILASFSEFEGFQMLLTEGMASGCAVVGYDAGGGREFLTPDVAFPVPASEIVGFAERIEHVTRAWDEDRDSVLAMTARAISWVRDRYTLAHEAADIVAAIEPARLRASVRHPGDGEYVVAARHWGRDIATRMRRAGSILLRG